MLESRRRYYFLTIAEYLNITLAAAKLMISQPSLTQYLQQLEAELGVELMDRKFTPLRLTPAGQIYFDYLKEAQSREEEMRARMAAISTGEHMPLRLGVPLQTSLNVTQTILPLFTRNYPNIRFSMWEGTTPSVINRVIQGELDIGFGHTDSISNSKCDSFPLRTERVVIVCNRQNPAAGGAESSIDNPIAVSPEALTGQRFYEATTEYVLHGVESKQLDRFGIKPESYIVMSHLYSRIADILLNPHSGFSFIPEYVLQESFPKSVLSQLAFLRLGDEDFVWCFSMLRKAGRKHSREARLFWNCIAEHSNS